ncbi:MAG: UDP-glucose/GDP-mannose dehydrogenase family protein [Phycisphaeraceae bacterium]|nr:UDP-glucose/GDP-mannose dehydrogenase family protein [Phycisphaeraceae bacterium]
MRIVMVGTGYVGLVTGTCFANVGNHVTCLDIDQTKIDKLNQGVCPIYEPGLEEMIRRNTKAGRLQFTTDVAGAYQSAEVIFICVGTPSDDRGRADLKYVLSAAADIGKALEAGPGTTSGNSDDTPPAKVIVVKSTVPVGTNQAVRTEIAKHTCEPFTMGSNPEFLKEGAAINDFNKPDRVVIGAEDEATGDRLRKLYDPFTRNGHPIFVMDIPSAEMVKYASNAMLATKISFINEIASLCENFGSNIDEVWRGMTSDKRIGNQFLYPGLGYGGSCFPKDVLACIAMGLQSGLPTPLLESVHRVNQSQRSRFIAKLDGHFGEGGLAGKKIAFWGIAFKPGTNDIREAPSLTLMDAVLERGASVVAHDPVAMATCQDHGMQDRVAYSDDMYTTLEGVDALVVCTDWPEFKQPDFEQMRERMSQAVIFDGRNLYQPESMLDEGYTYYSVGRQVVNRGGPSGPVDSEFVGSALE